MQDYIDSADISAWAAEGVRGAVSLGIMQGDETNRINPKNNATRAEAAVMMKRLAEQLQTYTVRVEAASDLGKAVMVASPEGSKLSFVAVTATSEPEPQNNAKNLIDGDLDTRWSYEGDQFAVADLGEVRTVKSIGLAFLKGDQRTQQIEIYLSEDGLNYGKLYSGNNSGKTTKLQYWSFEPVKARYVKIRSIKASTGPWQSINEICAYGE